MLPRVLHYLKREPIQAKNIKAFQVILVNLKWVITRERESAKDEKRSSDFTLTSYLHLRHRHSKNPVNMFPTRLPIFGEWWRILCRHHVSISRGKAKHSYKYARHRALNRFLGISIRWKHIELLVFIQVTPLHHHANHFSHTILSSF